MEKLRPVFSTRLKKKSHFSHQCHPVFWNICFSTIFRNIWAYIRGIIFATVKNDVYHSMVIVKIHAHSHLLNSVSTQKCGQGLSFNLTGPFFPQTAVVFCKLRPLEAGHETNRPSHRNQSHFILSHCGYSDSLKIVFEQKRLLERQPKKHHLNTWSGIFIGAHFPFSIIK